MNCSSEMACLRAQQFHLVSYGSGMLQPTKQCSCIFYILALNFHINTGHGAGKQLHEPLHLCIQGKKKGVLFTTFVMVYRKVKEFRQQLLIYLDVIEVSFTHN